MYMALEEVSIGRVGDEAGGLQLVEHHIDGG